VQLLGEWLKHATQRNQCEDSNGHISDVDCAFVLNSVAFLEVVRQVQNKANIIISIGRKKKSLYMHTSLVKKSTAQKKKKLWTIVFDK
jgi:coenzyme F420-reducing hydrogenase gamma subunit